MKAATFAPVFGDEQGREARPARFEIRSHIDATLQCSRQGMLCVQSFRLAMVFFLTGSNVVWDYILIAVFAVCFIGLVPDLSILYQDLFKKQRPK